MHICGNMLVFPASQTCSGQGSPPWAPWASGTMFSVRGVLCTVGGSPASLAPNIRCRQHPFSPLRPPVIEYGSLPAPPGPNGPCLRAAVCTELPEKVPTSALGPEGDAAPPPAKRLGFPGGPAAEPAPPAADLRESCWRSCFGTTETREPSRSASHLETRSESGCYFGAVSCHLVFGVKPSAVSDAD